jgi:hypothetical protein
MVSRDHRLVRTHGTSAGARFDPLPCCWGRHLWGSTTVRKLSGVQRNCAVLRACERHLNAFSKPEFAGFAGPFQIIHNFSLTPPPPRRSAAAPLKLHRLKSDTFIKGFQLRLWDLSNPLSGYQPGLRAPQHTSGIRTHVTIYIVARNSPGAAVHGRVLILPAQ